MISLYAAKTVDGGQMSSIRPTLTSVVAVILRASSAQSTYRSVFSAGSMSSVFSARNSGISVYGACGASVIARWMSHRNGTSAWQTPDHVRAQRRRGERERTALAAAGHRDGGARRAPASSSAVSIARTASVNSRV